MRFDAFDEGGKPVLIAFALDDYDKGDTLSFSTFSYKEGLPPGEYTLESGEQEVRIVLPEEATRQPSPGHLAGQSVRKAP